LQSFHRPMERLVVYQIMPTMCCTVRLHVMVIRRKGMGWIVRTPLGFSCHAWSTGCFFHKIIGSNH